MIYPVTMYAAKCDNCDKAWYNEHYGWTAMSDESSTQELIDNDGWHTEDDKHYCPDCFRFDDGDNMYLLTPDKKTTI